VALAAVGLAAVRELLLGLFDEEGAAFGVFWLLAAGALAPPLVPLAGAGLSESAAPAVCATAVGATVAIRRLNASAAAGSWLPRGLGGRSQGLLRDAVGRVMTDPQWLPVPMS
jgi:hypothetical protein